ncbi:hypothetical protein KKE26_07385 [bacterium]|nr:hypothetical protein [bacterium]MBU1752281.1 hypothetical protein [bacterium]
MGKISTGKIHTPYPLFLEGNFYTIPSFRGEFYTIPYFRGEFYTPAFLAISPSYSPLLRGVRGVSLSINMCPVHFTKTKYTFR